MFRRARLPDSFKPKCRPRKLGKVDEQLKASIAALETEARQLVENSITAKTPDFVDHTFSGIMFPIECLNELPIHFIEIQSVFVRGGMGPVSVYTCSYDPTQHEHLVSVPVSSWTRRFGPEERPPDFRRVTELVLSPPLRLAPTQIAGIYVHSEMEGDQALVYADRRSEDVTYMDRNLCIHSGIAHTSHVPFSNVNPIWGGAAWRASREFVGTIKYGTKYRLWTPVIHNQFPSRFREAIFAFLCTYHAAGKKPSKTITLGDISLDVFFRIVNFMPHDWFGKTRVENKNSVQSRTARLEERGQAYHPNLFQLIYHETMTSDDDDDEDDDDYQEEEEEERTYESDDDDEEVDYSDDDRDDSDDE